MNYQTKRALLKATPKARPKVCPKCDAWFDQQPRERVCVACKPRKLRTLTAVQVAEVKCASSQVEQDQNTPWGIEKSAVIQDMRTAADLARIKLPREISSEQVSAFMRGVNSFGRQSASRELAVHAVVIESVLNSTHNHEGE